MPALLFQKREADFATPISDDFILHHMPSANGNYVKVYLYVFHYFYRGQANDLSFSTKEVAASLRMLESDVLQALQYWHAQKALTLTENGEQLWLSFPPFGALPPSGSDPTGTEHPKVVRVEHKPTYSPEEINIYEQNPLIKDLFSSASRLLGEQFSFPNLSLLFSFYDYYRLPINVIKFLLEYCIQNGNRSLRYIEKVAQDWSDHGITTLEAAHAYVKRFDLYRPIMKALGISERRPTEQEIEMMDRWLYQYGHSLELITEAAARTMRKTGKPSFKYMESILKSWSENQIRTLEDVNRSDEAFAAKRNAANTTSARAPKGSNFHTYIGRDDWDFESIEKHAQQQLYSQEGN
ncbi:MAG: DnaD domain protein [Lachnospiraceae bacterium]|jgi:DnaD/phage-associated family protein|nr:DnaD domain protein [Lachnospiraceae bacterium]